MSIHIHVAIYGFDGSLNQGSVCGSDILSQRLTIYLSSKMAGQNFVVFNSMIFFCQVQLKHKIRMKGPTSHSETIATSL